MNKTVELVNYWGEFEGKNPDGSIADFCRDFLAQGGQERGGSLPETNLADLQENLLRVVGRIAKITTIFSGEVLNGTGVKTLEEAGLLLYVGAMRNPKKSEAIYNSLLELSGGVDMMNRLVRRGLLTEYADREDRRSKRMQLTAMGEKVVAACRVRLRKSAGMLTRDLSLDELLVCGDMLGGIDKKFTPFVQNLKNRSFDELCKELTGPDLVDGKRDR